MPTEHRVEQGESLYTIAKRFGFLNWRTIYDAPENDDLRSRRPNPQVLQPGDLVVIPDGRDPALTLALDRRTVIAKRKRGVQPLRLVLRGPEGETLADLSYTLTFDGGRLQGKTDKQGRLREEIPVGVVNVQLKAGRETRTLLVGHLNPLDEEAEEESITAVQGRLKNLGFYDGPLDGKTNPVLTEAIRLFQEEHDLPETGEADQETAQKILEVHGS